MTVQELIKILQNYSGNHIIQFECSNGQISESNYYRIISNSYEIRIDKLSILGLKLAKRYKPIIKENKRKKRDENIDGLYEEVLKDLS